MASAEGINPTILFNFNENNTTTVRDYSQSGFDGAGTNLTISSSTRVGYDGVFNGTTSELETTLSTIDDEISLFLAINPTSNTGTDYVLYSTKFQVTWNGTNLACQIITTIGTYSVSVALSTATWYDVYFLWSGTELLAYVDGSEITSIGTSGDFNEVDVDFSLGHKEGGDHAAFKLNEFRFYQDENALGLRDYIIAEQNGILLSSDKSHDFNLGDIIGHNIGLSNGSYAIVTYIATNSTYRIQPISNNLTNGMRFTRCGHLWDTDRQWLFVIDNTPQISFYDGISKTTEVASSTKKMYSLTREGIIKNSSTKTANYTILNTDQRIYVDSSGGTFTITLESSPTTNREIEIIDSTGNCGTFNVTVNGNGNNINGSSTGLITSNNEAWHLVYNGTQWNLK